MVLFSNKENCVLRIINSESLNCRTFLVEKNYWKNFYLNFGNYLFHEKGCHDNYVGASFKLIRAFFNYLIEENDPHPGFFHLKFYITNEEVPVIVLEPERLNFLVFDKEFEKQLPKHLKKIKDMFVFGCATALRHSDLAALTPANVEKINSNIYIKTRSIKTSTYTRVYLPDYAKAILLKYKRRKHILFPPLSLNNFNVGIKKICLLAGWTEDMDKIRSKRGITNSYFKDAVKKENYRFCDLISSHAMRRTAITTMLRMGMNEINVRYVSGHSANSASFHRYVYHSASFIDEEMDKVHSKMAAAKYIPQKK